MKTVDAGKETLGRDAALALASEVSRIIVSRGKKVVTFDLRKDRPDDETLAKHMLGPTGHLRAPTLRRGNVLLVGFNDATYREMLG